MRNYYVPGSWNVVCDVCGFKFKSHMLKQRWDGRMTCSKDYEQRHPMDLLRVPKDDPSVEWSRPEKNMQQVTFIETTANVAITNEAGVALVTEEGSTALPLILE